MKVTWSCMRSSAHICLRAPAKIMVSRHSFLYRSAMSWPRSKARRERPLLSCTMATRHCSEHQAGRQKKAVGATLGHVGTMSSKWSQGMFCLADHQAVDLHFRSMQQSEQAWSNSHRALALWPVTWCRVNADIQKAGITAHLPAQRPAAHPGEADLGDLPRVPHRLAVKIHNADLADRRLLDWVLLQGLLVLQVLLSEQVTCIGTSQLPLTIASNRRRVRATTGMTTSPAMCLT
jgi:hypothetical protein